MTAGYSLSNTEAAIYAAAFVLYEGERYSSIAAEAAFYSSGAGGSFVTALVDAHGRRMQAGILGTMETAVHP